MLSSHVGEGKREEGGQRLETSFEDGDKASELGSLPEVLPTEFSWASRTGSPTCGVRAA